MDSSLYIQKDLLSKNHNSGDKYIKINKLTKDNYSDYCKGKQIRTIK